MLYFNYRFILHVEITYNNSYTILQCGICTIVSYLYNMHFLSYFNCPYCASTALRQRLSCIQCTTPHTRSIEWVLIRLGIHLNLLFQAKVFVLADEASPYFRTRWTMKTDACNSSARNMVNYVSENMFSNARAWTSAEWIYGASGHRSHRSIHYTWYGNRTSFGANRFCYIYIKYVWKVGFAWASWSPFCNWETPYAFRFDCLLAGSTLIQETWPMWWIVYSLGIVEYGHPSNRYVGVCMSNISVLLHLY